MFTSLLVVSMLFAADAPTISEAVTDEHGFRVHRVTSEFQRGETLIRVLLPDQMESGRALKVLYVLPVEAGTERRYGDGLIEAKRLDLANRHQLICVAPTFSHLPWYADHPTDKAIQQESYFVKLVVPAVEKRYPALVNETVACLSVSANPVTARGVCYCDTPRHSRKPRRGMLR